MKTQETQEARKPLNWANTFDIVLSLKKCPPGNNIKKKYRDDFKFVGRQIIDVKSVNIMKYANVRKELVKNDLVDDLATSFEQQRYLHDQFPPIVILDSKQVSSTLVDDYGLLAGNNRFAAIKRIGWDKMIVDVYRCNKDRALLSVACTSNHHRAPFKVMTESDYVRAGKQAVWGTDSINPFLGNPPQKKDVKEYVEEIVGNMLGTETRKRIVNKIWIDRDINVTNEQFQPYTSSRGVNLSINSVDLFARGKNPNFPDIKIPYRGDMHMDDHNNTIEDYGYIMDNAQGIKDKLSLGIRKYNEGNTKKKVLFYIFIMSGKKDLGNTMISAGRKAALKKYNNELEQYAMFISSVSGMDIDEVKEKFDNIFKLVGFLPHNIGKDSKGNQFETTIVNEDGEPVHHLTGELL